MECAGVEQQRRLSQVKYPPDTANDNVVVSPRMTRMDLTLEVRHAGINNWNILKTGMGGYAFKLGLGPGSRKLRR